MYFFLLKPIFKKVPVHAFLFFVAVANDLVRSPPLSKGFMVIPQERSVQPRSHPPLADEPPPAKPGPEGEEAKRETLNSESQRLAWLLRLACHRDSSVRALAFSVLAEMAPWTDSSDMGINEGGGARHVGSNVGEWGVEDDDEEGEGEGGEVVRACLRAALNGSYESPAVVTEALRFLSRSNGCFFLECLFF